MSERVPTLAVLPVKRLELAKTRLSERLGEAERRRLAGAMIADVIDALLACVELDGVIVVTNETTIAGLAAAAGAEVVADPYESGQSAAAGVGIALALARSCARVLLVPGDCPALDGDTLTALLGPAGNAPAVTIVADRHGTGTNALVLSPPDVIAPAFGPDSFERHRALAGAAGAAWHQAALPGLELDIDTPEDLVALRLTHAGPHTSAVLVEI